MQNSGIRKVIARFENPGEVRQVYLAEDAHGQVVVGEETRGRTTALAYGDGVHTAEMRVSVEGLARALEALVPGQEVEHALATLFSDEDVFLSDLMDECDARGVAFWYTGVGDASGVTIRPSRAAWAERVA